jgi:uncharacterized protein with von Willebrand factor type A (vWA) domain
MNDTPQSLLFHVLGFIHALRSAGVATDPAGAIDLCRGLTRIDISASRDVHAAAQATLVHRREDLPVFDEVFREYWYRQRRARPGHRAEGDSDVSGPEAQPAPATKSPGDESGERKDLPGGYSPDEIIAVKDFAALSDEEIERARHLLKDFVSAFASLRSRRHIRHRRGWLLDFRRMMRRTATQGVDAVELVYRRRKIRKLRLMLLCDVSGSMERYARFLLEFIFAIRRELPKTEVAVFSTRMTVITDLLKTGTVIESLRQVARRAGDWGGGTDIGGCLREFNDLYARQLLHSDSVVVILSDGWDRGDARLLSDEFEHLRRRAHRIVWLNPLLGNPKYEPLTRGMRTALPHLDYFLPAHNLESLSRLARTLQTIWH